ncbi:MAG: MoaD/ThiS family protein [Desulfatitalea sp.]|nr:hypothetical protein [Desulfatitalea sp.]NNK00386.1 MoaD/ThiS family protein [Desulfatitalea sp.]
MRVKVFAPAFLHLSALDDEGYVTLPEGADVQTLLKALHMPMPLRHIGCCTVNAVRAKLKDTLKDGDTVSILALAAGG